MKVFALVILVLFLSIVGVGAYLGSPAIGVAVAFIAFGVWGIWMAMISPLQLQPVPVAALGVGLVILVFKLGTLA